MDTKWLIAIVIGNVIAAIIKESAGAILRRMPKMIATFNGKLMPRVIAILAKRWRLIDIVDEGVFSLFQFGLAFWMCWPGNRVNGGVVFFTALFVGYGFRSLGEFERKLFAYKHDPSV